MADYLSVGSVILDCFLRRFDLFSFLRYTSQTLSTSLYLYVIGNIYQLTSFGESHGIAIGGVIDGCPPGIFIDIDFIQNELNRRRPGQSSISSQRKETDKLE